MKKDKYKHKQTGEVVGSMAKDLNVNKESLINYQNYIK